MLFAPPFGLLAPGRAGSKDMSAFADQFSLQENGRNVKDFLKKTENPPGISATLPSGIMGLNDTRPFLPGNDLVHAFRKFFPRGFLLTEAVFHVGNGILLHGCPLFDVIVHDNTIYSMRGTCDFYRVDPLTITLEVVI